MTEDYRELLLGCGRARDKRIEVPVRPSRDYTWRHLTTLDLNPYCGADLQCDLNAAPPWVVFPRTGQALREGLTPIDSARGIQTRSFDYDPVGRHLLPDFWDEIHAYEVLEHLGQQGDASAFFNQFSELYRLLKPNGYLCATVPSRFSPWLWGDPSHRRVIVPESLIFLDQEQYKIQIDRRIADHQYPTNMSDFRDSLGYRADFKLVDQHDNRTTFTFILQAVKPSRYKIAMNERFGALGESVHRKPNLSPEMNQALDELESAREELAPYIERAIASEGGLGG